MRAKEKIHYIYFCCEEGKRKRIRFVKESLEGIQILKIVVEKGSLIQEKDVKKFENIHLQEKFFKRIKKELKKYEIKNCVIGAEYGIAKKLHIEHQMFQARKLEMMENWKRIIDASDAKEKKEKNKRKSFLLMLDSMEWNQKDVMSLLLETKNYYEEINLIVKKNRIVLEQIAETLYEEWGIVLHILPHEMILKKKIDFAVFLLENWSDNIKEYDFNNGYVVVEEESDFLRKYEITDGMIWDKMRYREKINKIEALNGRKNLYAGFIYVYNGKVIPYQMAINMYNQNLQLYHEFAITSVDIYLIE